MAVEKKPTNGERLARIEAILNDGWARRITRLEEKVDNLTSRQVLLLGGVATGLLGIIGTLIAVLVR